MASTPSRKQLQVRLNNDIHAKMRIIAEKEHRPLNSQIEYYCMKGIEQYEKANGPIDIRKDND